MRLVRPEKAVDPLLVSSAGFQFDEWGLATGGPFPYFPSNVGRSYAVALMARGWDGAPKVHSPGFPQGRQVEGPVGRAQHCTLGDRAIPQKLLGGTNSNTEGAMALLSDVS